MQHAAPALCTSLLTHHPNPTATCRRRCIRPFKPQLLGDGSHPRCRAQVLFSGQQEQDLLHGSISAGAKQLPRHRRQNHVLRAVAIDARPARCRALHCQSLRKLGLLSDKKAGSHLRQPGAPRHRGQPSRQRWQSDGGDSGFGQGRGPCDSRLRWRLSRTGPWTPPSLRRTLLLARKPYCPMPKLGKLPHWPLEPEGSFVLPA